MKLISKLIRAFKFYFSIFLFKLKVSKLRLFDYDREKEVDININSCEVNGFDIPKIVWMYWEGGEIPKYIIGMISVLKSKNMDHEINILNEDTIVDYIPSILDISNDMPLANKSDIIRLELLKKFGGIWIDASSLIMEELSWVHDLNSKLGGYDLIGYYRDVSTTNYSRPIIESWFLCAPPENKFICSWLEALSPLKEVGAMNYYHMLLERDDYNEIKQNIGRPEYLLVYYAQQIAMKKESSFNLYARMCENNAFLYQTEAGWKGNAIACQLCINLEPEVYPPIIKLTHGDRISIERILKIKSVNKKSIIGRLVY